MTIPQKPKTRNIVAKNSHHKTGAGAHEEKAGKRSKRAKQTREWKREANMIREMNASLSVQDPYETALMELENPCAEYLDITRIEDFAEAIAEIMKSDGVGYAEAKAQVFDEQQVPPNGGPCCVQIKAVVDKIIKK